MTDTSDAPQDRCVVVVNADGQHALWPASDRPPAGWTAAYGPAARPSCIAYVDAHWTDMRPLSLAAFLG